MKPETSNFRQVADTTIAHQPHRPETGEKARHYFSAVGSVAPECADLLQGNHGRLRSFLHFFVKLDELVDSKGLGLGHSFHLCRHGMAAHSPQLWKQAANFERSKASLIRPNFKALDGIAERG